jgi:uncharacterized protein YkwD
LRRLAAAALAVPPLVTLYVPVLLRRSIAARIGLALGIGGLLGVAAVGALVPRGTLATAPSSPAPVASTAFGPNVRTNVGPHAAVDVTFSQPMDRAAVAEAITLSPSRSVQLEWNAAGTTLMVRPATIWATGTYYTITIGSTAADRAGHQLGAPLRVAFVTRTPTLAKIAATRMNGRAADVRTAFRVTFDHPVDAAAAARAFRISPAIDGSFVLPAGGETRELTFEPLAPLAANTLYQVTLEGTFSDADGADVGVPNGLAVRTVRAPKVVRFRPQGGTDNVARRAQLSVRFSQRMNRATTTPAFSVTANGGRINGRTSWAEGDTVLVFRSNSALPADTRFTMTVGAGATGRNGTAIAAAAQARFHTVKAATAPTAVRTAAASVPIPHASGGSVGSGSWYAVEVYYLKLMNCTRTGGWVLSNGSCSSPGGLSTPPIILDSGLSNKVARPYAKLLAQAGACTHFYNGSPTDRLHRAGYSGWLAENVGCRSAPNAYASVLGTHLYFQSEKPCGGYCHYANLMNPDYKRCGIGVWVYAGRIRLVVDFYHP